MHGYDNSGGSYGRGGGGGGRGRGNNYFQPYGNHMTFNSKGALFLFAFSVTHRECPVSH